MTDGGGDKRLSGQLYHHCPGMGCKLLKIIMVKVVYTVTITAAASSCELKEGPNAGS